MWLAVLWAIEAGGAIGHAQPVPRHIVERKVLAEHISLRRVAVGQRMIGLIEGHAHMRARGARGCLLCRCRRIGSAALGAARYAARRPANAAHHTAFQRKHGAAAQRYEQPAVLDEALQLCEAIPSDAAGDVIRLRGRAEAWRLRQFS